MLIKTDIPYLEPLLFWLRKDETLKEYFTEKSYFMPHNNLITATEEAMKADCPAPRAIWILPQDSIASSQRPGCKSPSVHTFYIEIIVQCIRDQFQLVKKNDEVKLEGQFMELATIRRYVKESVLKFSNTQKTLVATPSFDDIIWVKDQMLYPADVNNFLATAIEYQVKIF